MTPGIKAGKTKKTKKRNSHLNEVELSLDFFYFVSSVTSVTSLSVCVYVVEWSGCYLSDVSDLPYHGLGYMSCLSSQTK